MANIQRKTITVWDGGIKTSSRESLQNTSLGAQMIKGFDIYKDPKKMIPMQSWESFTTDAEKAYGIRAMGGTGDTVYGLGNALSNWYGSAWSHRVKVTLQNQFHLANMPLWLDMSRLPADFWTHVNSDMSDVRVTGNDGITEHAVFTENVDTVNKTGDMWVEGSAVDVGTTTIQTIDDYNGTGAGYTGTNTATGFAHAIPLTLTGQTFNVVKINLKKVQVTAGITTDVICELFTNNAGVPGTLVQELGRIDIDSIDTITRDYTIACDSLTLTGSYWLVFYTVTADTSNYIVYTYSSSGTTSIYAGTNAGHTTWSVHDATATPNYELLNYANTVSDKSFYIYYGNSTATAIAYGTPVAQYTNGGREAFIQNNTRWNYTFGGSESGNRYYTDNDTGDDEAFTTDPQVYTTGLFGKAIQTFGTNINTDAVDDVGLSGDDVSFSLMVKITAGAAVDLYKSASGYWTIALDANRKILFTVTGSLGTATKTSTIALSVDTWHVVDCVFDGNYYISIDGVKETFSDADGNYDGDPNGDIVRVNTGAVATLAQLVAYDNDLTDNQIATKFQNFTNPYFYSSIGSEEDKTSVNLQYGGVQLYYKLISSGDWLEYLEGGRPVKNLAYYPVNSFVDDSGTYFVVSSLEGNTGFLYLSQVDSLTVLDITHLSLGFSQLLNAKTIPQPENAIDATTYFNIGSASLASVGDPGSASEFTNSTSIETIAAWRTYLALGGSRRNRAYLNIWDLSSTLSTEKCDMGNGFVRIVGNAGDELFAVIDNFIDDEIKSTGKPTMEVKQYIGNGQVKTTHRIEVPVNIDDSTYADYWERAVSNFKIRRNTQTLFYARLPKDATGTTFNEGFWAVGKNSQGELSLTLQIDTEGLGMPENVFAFAQQVFFIAKDGGICRLSDDTYENTALFKSLKFNEGNTEIEKKLIGVEIITEPLESGQTISVYYKKNGDADRTKIFDMTGEDEISYETTYDINEANLPHYKEIEFDIESTGGKSAPLELAYKYEYLSNIV